MVTETMSLAKALAELKQLDQRIITVVSQTSLVGVSVGTKNPRIAFPNVGNVSVADFEKACVAAMQSVNDLIKRRAAIKAALVVANATTKVSIAGTEMTVAEAVEMKSHIRTKQQVLSTIKTQKATALQRYEGLRVQLDNNKNELINTQPSDKSNADLYRQSQEVQLALMDSTYAPAMIDPNKLESVITQMESEINTYLCDVDYALNTVNATTQISISY